MCVRKIMQLREQYTERQRALSFHVGLRICEEAYAQETHIKNIRTFAPPVWERRSEVEELVFASWSPPEVRLREGMVVAPEWYNQTRYGAMLFEETFLVGRDGLEPLVSYQRELWEISR